SIRVTFPNRHYDPRLGADIWHRNLDLYLHADSVGLDVMVNEHHATPSCIDSALAVISGALARQTTDARILQLGNPVANRRDPVRIAEETALVDVLSRGRLEVGMIRGVPYEVIPANSHPVGTNERMWEAHDLIKAAWTSHDGPFNYESENFQFRNVNIFPRPYQDPHPPIWFVAMSPGTNVKLAEYGYVSASFLLGYDTRPLFDVYRKQWRELGRPGEAPMDRFALMALVYCADTEAAARSGAEKLGWYLTGPTHQVAPQFNSPPGYNSVEATVRALRQRAAGQSVAGNLDLDSLNKRGTLIYGTPDSVYEQLLSLYKAVGFGNLLLHGHAGHMEYEETSRSLTLLAQEVLPRLREAERNTELLDASIAGSAR
uniref:LLM class flavin-dependent oxidoreductase n=1 Tax=Streptomyces blattellae TaxID=2569855 RepID=UPI0012B7338D